MVTQVHAEPTDEQVEHGVAMLKLLADGTRLRILWALLHGEHSVNELAYHLGAQPAAVSQHLAKLRLGRVVRVRRDGTHMFYAADDDHVLRLVEEALFHADRIRAARPGRSRTRRSVPSADRKAAARARTR